MEKKLQGFTKVDYKAFEEALKNEEKAEFQLGEKAYVPIVGDEDKNGYSIKEVRLCGVYFDTNKLSRNREDLFGYGLYVDANGNIYDIGFDGVCTDRNVAYEIVSEAYEEEFGEEWNESL